MKTFTTAIVLRMLLIIAAFLPFTKANAYDFEVDNLQYSITSPTTVKVIGQTFCDYNDYHFRIIEIPKHVTYNNVLYSVTSIGDSVFYFTSSISLPGNGNETGMCCEIKLPETISSIGYKAFGGYIDILNIICLAKTPPAMNFSFENQNCSINLFVHEEAFSLYEQINNQNQFFDSIFITNGARSNCPYSEYHELYQPVGGPYGCTVKIYTSDKNIISSREFINWGLSDNIFEWSTYSSFTEDCIYYFLKTIFHALQLVGI